MIVLLPPSESKIRPEHAGYSSVDLNQLSFAQLNPLREQMMQAAILTASSSQAMEDLKIPKSQPELAQLMTQVNLEPVAPALQVYSGVLYEALGSKQLENLNNGQLLIASALFGLIDAKDPIPAYRLSADSKLIGIGKVGSWWKSQLKAKPELLSLERELIIDCRSGAYKNMIPLDNAHVLEVNPIAYQEQSDGSIRKKVISHDAKKYRGMVAKALIEANYQANSANEVVEVLKAAFGDQLGVELEQTAKTSLTVIDYWARR